MKICYFGIYNPALGKNSICIKGFKENGAEIIECRDNSHGPLKFMKLFLKHRKIKNDYDFMMVGYPGHAVVWLAKLVSKKLVIFDALCTMYEGVVISRGQGGTLGLRSLYVMFLDWLAVKCADIVLVETERQREFFEKRFGKSSKYKVVYTGADDTDFYKDESITKKEKFTAVFRGKFLPEAGVKYVIEAAKILEDEKIDFVIIGNGFLEKEIKFLINKIKPKNLLLISEYLSFDEIRNRMLSCHVSLGQFEDHERLLRTIPHKCFETLALGLPYITSRSVPVAEILQDGESCLFVNPADAKDLAEKILYLKNNPKIAEDMGNTGRGIYLKNFTPKIIAQRIIDITKQ